jgi:hypothetical protein
MVSEKVVVCCRDPAEPVTVIVDVTGCLGGVEPLETVFPHPLTKIGVTTVPITMSTKRYMRVRLRR